MKWVKAKVNKLAIKTQSDLSSYVQETSIKCKKLWTRIILEAPPPQSQGGEVYALSCGCHVTRQQTSTPCATVHIKKTNGIGKCCPGKKLVEILQMLELHKMTGYVVQISHLAFLKEDREIIWFLKLSQPWRSHQGHFLKESDQNLPDASELE